MEQLDDKERGPQTNQSVLPHRGWVRWLLIISAVGYCGLAMILWLGGDATWYGTLLLFSPRYYLAAPLVVLAALIPFCKRWSAVAAACLVLFGMFTVCGLCLPWRTLVIRGTPELRVLTFNSAGFKTGTRELENLVAETKPDVVLIEEVSRGQAIGWPAGWSSWQDGELVIASRHPLKSKVVVNRELPDRWPRAIAMLATVDAPAGEYRVGVLHLLSPRVGLSQMVSSRTILNLTKCAQVQQEIDWRRTESRRVAGAVTAEHGNLVLAGDFNMPVESRIYRRDWADLRNAFSGSGLGFGNTCFIQKGPLRLGARIDHILFSKDWTCTRCWVGPHLGSDHRPVIADLRRNLAGK